MSSSFSENLKNLAPFFNYTPKRKNYEHSFFAQYRRDDTQKILGLAH